MNRGQNLSLLRALLLCLLLPVSLASAQAMKQRYMLEGDFTQGGLIFGKTEPGTEVRFNQRKVRISTDGGFLLGFHRDDGEEHELVLTYQDGHIEKRVILVSGREYQIQHINGLPKRKVEPNTEDMKRIRREYALVGKARKVDDARTDFASGFIWPVIGPISGVYGSQRVLNGKPRRPHYGVDIARPTGTPVKAPADGVITLSHPDMFFSGGTLMLDHGHGLSSSFLHLSRLLVKEGDRVKQGEVIAEIGATGRVTGAHLDWRMNLFEKRIDPQLLVPPMPEHE